VRRASSIFGSAILAASLATPLALASAPAATAGVAAPAVRVVAAAPGVAPGSVIDALEAAGYHVHVALLPDAYYVTESARARGLPAGVRALEVGPAGPVSLAGEGEMLVTGAAARENEHDPFGGHADALPPVRLDAADAPRAAHGVYRLPPGLPYGTRWEDTSELMIGRVAVPLLFPESDGTVDPNHFDWTPALRDSIVRSAVRGFLKWSLFAESRAITLTFLIETHSGLATRYEPIDRPIGQETLWIEDVLEPLLGYRGSAVSMAYEVANAARSRLSAQWATLAFAVQNDTSATGTFPDGYISHARLGGPYFVIPINNLNTQSASVDFYFQHEVTHQFWALDEFPALNAWWACTLTTGYFNRPNWNASVPADGYCGVPTVHCLMKGNYPDDFCAYTLDQVGWVDLDRNGTLDLYETRPVVRPDSSQYRAPAGLPITLRGRASESAYPNENPYHFEAGDSISIATLDSIQYRLDGIVWATVACGDGRCDSGEEAFTLVLPPPSIGSHTVEWRAWNSNGKTAVSPSSTMITVSGGTGAIDGFGPAASAAPRVTVAPRPSRGGARFVVSATPGSRGTATVFDIAGRPIRHWSISVPEGGRLAGEWDARRDSGGNAPAGLYFLVVTIGANMATQRVVLLR
jgi:hypothetical protein